MKVCFRNRLKKEHLRPIVYKTFSRGVLAVTLILLWNRFINQSGLLSVRVHGFFFAGAVFLALAWISYLRLTGIKIPKFPEWPKRNKHINSYGDIADYCDEHIISFDELEENDRHMCTLIANLNCGLAFLLISMV